MGPEARETPIQPAGSYLYEVLADGARSFPFRGGVCSLLGISDWRDGLIILPPVLSGFIRPQPAQKNYTMPGQHLSSSTGCLSSSSAVREFGIQGEECISTEPRNMKELDKATRPGRCSGDYGMECELQTEKAEKAAADIVADRIEIPGVTDSKIEFRALLTVTAEGQAQPDENNEPGKEQAVEKISGSRTPKPVQVECNNSVERVFHEDNTGNAAAGISGYGTDISGATEQRQMRKRKNLRCSEKQNSAQADRSHVDEPESDSAENEKKEADIASESLAIPGITDSKILFDLLSISSNGSFQPAEQLIHRDSNRDIRARAEAGNPGEQSEVQKGKNLHGFGAPNSVSENCRNVDEPEFHAAETGKTEFDIASESMFMNGEDATLAPTMKDNHEKRDDSLSAELKLAMLSMTGNNDCADIPEDARSGETASNFRGNGKLSGHFHPRETLGERTGFKAQNSGAALPDSDMAGVLDTLENHLRQKIDQLRDVSRKRLSIGMVVTEETEKNREQEHIQQMQMPQQQRFVVVKHISRRNSTSAAFWERSYLGRLRLRPLR